MTNKQIVADITKRLLLGESLTNIWFDSICQKKLPWLKILLDKFNVNINVTNQTGANAIIYAVNMYYTTSVKYLLKYPGIDLYIKNNRNQNLQDFIALRLCRR